ncbi:hypothetical protein DEU56DRAFT_761850 [Suillus clintonianus]|uniref:uncharacterized protein n=1 Tax=Suillus clintonianus TaxID=1904413 RepID=UPI001B8746D5|nr:uncharacterized protein DEU56DRAFT_761850 [Suillus clintonianus]KAG2114394.1 hypothetical protein DEU56DRAFT_761850 [Suillus clintonianus]
MFSINGVVQVWIDHAASFGGASSNGIFGRPGDAIVVIFKFNGVQDLLKWVDDYIFFRYPTGRNQRLESAPRQRMQRVEVRESQEPETGVCGPWRAEEQGEGHDRDKESLQQQQKIQCKSYRLRQAAATHTILEAQINRGTTKWNGLEVRGSRADSAEGSHLEEAQQAHALQEQFTETQLKLSKTNAERDTIKSLSLELELGVKPHGWSLRMVDLSWSSNSNKFKLAPPTICATGKKLVFNIMVKQFPLFLFDHCGWKVKLLCITNYPSWRKNNIGNNRNWKDLPSKLSVKEEHINDSDELDVEHNGPQAKGNSKQHLYDNSKSVVHQDHLKKPKALNRQRNSNRISNFRLCDAQHVTS